MGTRKPMESRMRSKTEEFEGRSEKLVRHPHAGAVENGEEGKPEEDRIKAATEDGEGGGEQADGGDGCAEKEVDLLVVKGAQELADRGLQVGWGHGRS